MDNKKVKMSKTRKIYFLRLVGRCIAFCLVILLYILRPTDFEVIKGLGFFRYFSPLHVLWLIWVLDMVLQLIPVKAHISIGSQKQFQALFKPIKEKVNYRNLKKYIIDTTADANKVLIMWIALIVVLSVLKLTKVISAEILFLFSVCFYVCDLVCVLIWCPFRLILKNKCCTTCRIFNWDHFMMFSPLITVTGFYTWSLLIFSVVILLIWEFCVFMYPERFWEHSNMALKCSECTDKLCTQYCRKLKK